MNFHFVKKIVSHLLLTIHRVLYKRLTCQNMCYGVCAGISKDMSKLQMGKGVGTQFGGEVLYNG